MKYTVDQVKEIFQDAEIASFVESNKYFTETLGGKDNYPCGFAWVEIFGVRANSKMGQVLESLGMRKDSYRKAFIMHSRTPNVQNMDVQYLGAEAAAKVLQKAGFRAYATSRID